MDKNTSTRDSGIEAMGIIPSNWKTASFSKVNWIRSRLGWKGLKAEEYVDKGFPFLSAFNIVNSHLSWTPLNYITQERYDESPEIKLSVGDIILVKDGAGIGKVARVDELPLGESTVNSSLAVISAKSGLHYKYTYYFLLSPLFSNIIARLCNGMGVPHLTQESMKEIKMPFPPLAEQKTIATFLDDQITQIDSIVSEARTSIEEYKAWKASIIYEAVTKGLDPDVEMKDSGVKFLGKIPGNWKVSAVRHLISVLTDYTANGSFGDLAKNVSYQDQGYARVVRLTDLRADFKNSGIFVDKHAYDYLSKSSLFGGEILLANVGAYAGLAVEMPYVGFNATLGPNMFLIKTNEELWDSHYAYYSLLSNGCANQLRIAANKTTAQPKINKEDLREVKTVLPPKKIQRQITEYLDSHCKEINSLVSEKESLISDLEAYKKSLIFETVTGKRKVV